LLKRLVLPVSAFLFVQSACAVIVPRSNTQDWDTHPASGVGNWSVLGSAASITENTSGGDHWLQIDFPSIGGGAPGSAWYETISVPAEDLFAGSWDTTMFLQYDFFAQNTPPAGMQVRFAGTNGNTWGYAIDTGGMATGDWHTYQASLSNWEDWRINPFLTEADYLADLESMDWIGLYLYRDGLGAETYGLDDFNLMVPEPAEIAFLGSALAAVVASIRRRKKSSVPRDP